jgi:hypothetical protein
MSPATSCGRWRTRRTRWAYGTLASHPECGEEVFVVERTRDGTVWLTVSAFSRGAKWHAWAAACDEGGAACVCAAVWGRVAAVVRAVRGDLRLDGNGGWGCRPVDQAGSVAPSIRRIASRVLGAHVLQVLPPRRKGACK